MDKPFSISDSYKINKKNFYFSNSHSKNIHVITVSYKMKVAIDTEEYKDKNKMIYNKFYECHTPIYTYISDYKQEFYRNWILYEISEKLNRSPKSIYRKIEFLHFYENIIGYTKVSSNICIVNLDLKEVNRKVADVFFKFK